MNKDQILELVIRNVREVLPELERHAFVPDDELTKLGANSLDRAEIVNLTLEAMALRIPRVQLFGVKNLGQLVDVLYEKARAA
jgi:polyketide biosynthesis acyl carrier protein